MNLAFYLLCRLHPLLRLSHALWFFATFCSWCQIDAWMVRLDSSSSRSIEGVEAIPIATVLPHLGSLLSFFVALLDDSNFKIVLSTLECLKLLFAKMGRMQLALHMADVLPPLIEVQLSSFVHGT